MRALEMLESVRLIVAALRKLPGGPIRPAEPLISVPAGEVTARAEAPRSVVMLHSPRIEAAMPIFGPAGRRETRPIIAQK